jgi:hypothetical protein
MGEGEMPTIAQGNCPSFRNDRMRIRVDIAVVALALDLRKLGSKEEMHTECNGS